MGLIGTILRYDYLSEDSKKTGKRAVEVQVEWDEKGDLMKGLLKKLLNNEITVEQYQAISKDIKENF